MRYAVLLVTGGTPQIRGERVSLIDGALVFGDPRSPRGLVAAGTWKYVTVFDEAPDKTPKDAA